MKIIKYPLIFFSLEKWNVNVWNDTILFPLCFCGTQKDKMGALKCCFFAVHAFKFSAQSDISLLFHSSQFHSNNNVWYTVSFTYWPSTLLGQLTHIPFFKILIIHLLSQTVFLIDSLPNSKKIGPICLFVSPL